MLKTVLSISGKPGLYKLISSAKNMVIVESLTENRKVPIHARDKVVSLGDISIYTEEGEATLKEVLTNMKEKENGAICSVSKSAKPADLLTYFSEILPSYDSDRVYPTDVKKIIGWYNILTEANFDFSKEKESAEQEEITE